MVCNAARDGLKELNYRRPIMADVERLEKEIEHYRMMRELAVNDIAFFGGGQGYPFVLLLNDTFYYPSADGETIGEEEIPAVYHLWKEGGRDALFRWAENKRGMKVLTEVQEEMIGRGALRFELEALRREKKQLQQVADQLADSVIDLLL